MLPQATGDDPYHLQRFVQAQEPVYTTVCAELATGKKRSHWMWFVFSQVRGLGSSPTSQHFAISGIEEAIAYLNHDVLGPHLRECTSLVNAVQNRSASEIFGYPDDLKFHSSMTLFHTAAQSAGQDGTPFTAVMDRYFSGRPDAATLQRLGSER